MKLIIESDSLELKKIQGYISEIKLMFEDIFAEIGLTTVQKFVVTDNDDRYIKSINKHAGHIDNNIRITNDDHIGVCVVIRGIDKKNNTLNQVIFVKDFIFNHFILSMIYSNILDQKQIESLAYSKEIIFHEIGHALDYQIMFETYMYNL
jgi:hypothetical protein